MRPMVNLLRRQPQLPKYGRILAGQAAEVAFAVLPVVVVAIVLSYYGRHAEILSSPEWSFGTSILFGQTVVKFMSGAARARKADMGPVALAAALILVFAVAPSLLLLAFTLQATEPTGPKSVGPWVRTLQPVLFFVAGILYMLLGTVAEMWYREGEKTAVPCAPVAA